MGLPELIASTFDGVPSPGDQDLSECLCGECRHGVSRFIGKDWRSLRFKDVVSDQDDSNIKQLSSRGFQYFLPGLMLLALKPHVDSFWIASDILDRLTSSDSGVGALEIVRSTIDLLSPRQREVIAQFIERLRDDEDLCPVILASAHENVITGVAKPYAQRGVEEWVKRRLDARSKPPDLSSGR